MLLRAQALCEHKHSASTSTLRAQALCEHKHSASTSKQAARSRYAADNSLIFSTTDPDKHFTLAIGIL